MPPAWRRRYFRRAGISINVQNPAWVFGGKLRGGIHFAFCQVASDAWGMMTVDRTFNSRGGTMLVLPVFEQQRLGSSVTRPGNCTSTSGPISGILFVD
jgi:hypothetical protein